jgi:hypothetical protein
MTAAQTKRTGTTRLVDTVEDAEHTSFEAVRKFVDTVDIVFPSRSNAAFTKSERLHMGGPRGPAPSFLGRPSICRLFDLQRRPETFDQFSEIHRTAAIA